MATSPMTTATAAMTAPAMTSEAPAGDAGAVPAEAATIVVEKGEVDDAGEAGVDGSPALAPDAGAEGPDASPEGVDAGTGGDAAPVGPDAGMAAEGGVTHSCTPSGCTFSDGTSCTYQATYGCALATSSPLCGNAPWQTYRCANKTAEYRSGCSPAYDKYNELTCCTPSAWCPPGL